MKRLFHLITDLFLICDKRNICYNLKESFFNFLKISVSSLGFRKLSHLQGTRKPKYLQWLVIKIKDVHAIHAISNPVWYAVICILF